MHKRLKDEVALNGWAMRPSGIIAFEQPAAADEFERLFAQKAAESGYENVAQLDAAEITRLPTVSAMMGQVERIVSEISPELQFSKLWLVKSKEVNVHALVVPFVPHFDKQRFLKAMVYLDDVTAGDGPFTVASQPPSRTDARRRALPNDYKERGLNVVRDVPAGGFTACIGAAGTVIFFDTNTPHYAGHVRGAGQRRVFRFDFTNPTWNRPRLGVRIARKMFRMKGG